MREQVHFTVRLAGYAIAIHALHEETRHFLDAYQTQETPELEVSVTAEDIVSERERSAREDRLEGIPVRRFSDAYLETLALYRKIADALLMRDTLLFHGSVIAVDGEGYLFIAKSGTGKSTHTRLWREQFGSRAVMVNDDKPLLGIGAQGVLAFGTPWDGKHRLSNNLAVPLKAICILERAEQNHIERLTDQALRQSYPTLVQQSYRGASPQTMISALRLLDELMKRVPIYHLGCNMEREAARVAYEGMR